MVRAVSDAVHETVRDAVFVRVSVTEHVSGGGIQ